MGWFCPRKPRQTLPGCLGSLLFAMAFPLAGLPCPNLSTGGFSFHGVFEAIPVAAMDKMVEVLLHLVTVA